MQLVASRVRILAYLALAMVGIVKVRDGVSQWFDASSGTILSRAQRYVDGFGPRETALNVIVCFWSTLAQIRPFALIVVETLFVCPFRAPHHSGRSSTGIETGVRTVSFVGIAELTMDLRPFLSTVALNEPFHRCKREDGKGAAY